MNKQWYFVKAVKRGFVCWQGYQCAASAELAIELARMCVVADRGATWTAAVADR